MRHEHPIVRRAHHADEVVEIALISVVSDESGTRPPR
jgi:hypothetical protein